MPGRGEPTMQMQCDFEQANLRKYPEQIAVAIARDANGRYNPITLGWMTQVSADPPMLAIAVGKSRYSAEVIRGARQFVVALPSDLQQKDVMIFGTKSGREVDKLAQAGTKTQPAVEIDSVLLEYAVANFECRLTGEVEAGDHVIFIGEVVCSHVSSRQAWRLFVTGPGYRLGCVPPATAPDAAAPPFGRAQER